MSDLRRCLECLKWKKWGEFDDHLKTYCGDCRRYLRNTNYVWREIDDRNRETWRRALKSRTIFTSDSKPIGSVYRLKRCKLQNCTHLVTSMSNNFCLFHIDLLHGLRLERWNLSS